MTADTDLCSIDGKPYSGKAAEWCVRGFGGIVKLLEMMTADGVPFGKSLVVQLKAERDKLTRLIEQIDSKRTGAI